MSVLLAASLAANVALAVTAPSKVVSFDDAIGLSAASPDVQGARRAVEKKHEMTSRISSMTENPQIYLQPGMRLLPAENKGWEVQGSVMQSWNLAGLASARKNAASVEAAELSAEARALALSRRLGAARAWIDLWAAQRTLEVARREAALGGDFARLVDKALAASAATKADAADARAYHAEARLVVIGAEGEVFERGLELSRALAAGAEPVAAGGDLPSPALPARATWPGAVRRASALPSVQKKALAAEAERARDAEERAARGTVLSLGVAVQRDSPGGFVAYGALGLTLPTFNRGERERSVTAARAAQLEGDKQREAADAAADLAMALHEVEHTQEVLDALQNEILPALDEGLAARVRIFEGGEGTILEVVQARRNAAAARGRLERARAENAWAKVKVFLLLAAMDAGKAGEKAR
ncbi:TolC family protein [Polyangium aurulentum]|uniref:TolC family protein n=1 Tax=Polyangium aurulentum TaxID=2567896 RepID=UPI0010AE7B4B|nr:TolC family protein [Polyangium aurulentum]UQA58707.1 TolC family protein [Polyangium aurulentum]